MELEMQQETKKKELVKRQVERRKYEEAERARRARDMMMENRQRLAIRNELLVRGDRLDDQARGELAKIAYMRSGDVMEELLNLHARNEMVESEEDAYIRAMLMQQMAPLSRVEEEAESGASPSAGVTPLSQYHGGSGQASETDI